MGRNGQVSRILRLIHYLDINPQGLAARDILKKLNEDGYACSRETVYRDLRAIQQAMLPLEQDGSGDTSMWKLASIAVLNKGISFTYNELLALFIARRSLETLRGSPVYDVLDQFFVKLEKLFGPRANEALAEFADHLGFKPRSSWQTGVAQEILDTIHTACVEGHCIEMEYQSVSGDRAGEFHMRKIGPECIYFADSGLYLVGKDILTGIHKTYSLSRVRRVALLDDHHDSSGFSAGEFFKHGIGVLGQGDVAEVVLKISEPMASYIAERRWHDTQRVVRSADGITLTLAVRVNEELARWILGLGPSASVVAPAELATLVEKMAEKVTSLYKRAA